MGTLCLVHSRCWVPLGLDLFTFLVHKGSFGGFSYLWVLFLGYRRLFSKEIKLWCMKVYG